MGERRLLVIDDEADIGRIICKVASQQGFAARATQDPASFQAMYRCWQPDVVVLDLAIPQVDGIELLQFLQGESSTARILLVSGMEGSMLKLAENLGAAYGLRIVGSMAKPFRVRDLQNALTTAARDAGEAHR